MIPFAVHRHWQLAGTVVVMAAAVPLVLSWESVAAMIATWSRSITFNHGFLIPLISAWLIWRMRAALGVMAPKPNYWGIAIVLAFGAMCLLGRIAGALVVEQLAVLGIVQGIALTVFGWWATRALAFPLLYLYFAVPVGEFMIPWLQDVTAMIAILALRWTGVPALLDGVLIHLPTATFEVAKACAGLNFLISTVVLAVLFAHVVLISWWRQLTFVAVALTVSVIANGVRVYGIILIAYLTNNQYAIQFDHIIYGWMFLAVVTMIVLGIGVAMRGKSMPQPDRRGSEIRIVRVSRVPTSTVWAGIVAAAAAAVGPSYAGYLEARANGLMMVPFSAPKVLAPWSSVAVSNRDWVPEFPAADARIEQRYVRGQRSVTLIIAYYGRQRPGAEATSAVNKFVDGRVWQQVEIGSRQTMLDRAALTVRYSRIVSGRASKLVWYWYWVDETFTASPYAAKVLEAKAKLLGGTTAAAVLVVAADIKTSPLEAEGALDEFLRDLRLPRRLLEPATQEDGSEIETNGAP